MQLFLFHSQGLGIELQSHQVSIEPGHLASWAYTAGTMLTSKQRPLPPSTVGDVPVPAVAPPSEF